MAFLSNQWVRQIGFVKDTNSPMIKDGFEGVCCMLQINAEATQQD
jgi:hypothetical protein